MAFPSTFGDITNAVIAKLRLHPTDDLSRVHDWINQVYTEACVELELIQQTLSSTLTANVGSYTLDPTIARIKSITAVSSGSTGRPLDVLNDLSLREYRANNSAVATTGTVTGYTILGLKQIEFWPTPVAADTVYFDFVARPTPLSANGDVPVIPEPYASKVLEYGALAEGADFLNLPQQETYRQLYEFWKKKLRGYKNLLQGGHAITAPVIPYVRLTGSNPSTDLGY